MRRPLRPHGFRLPSVLVTLAVVLALPMVGACGRSLPTASLEPDTFSKGGVAPARLGGGEENQVVVILAPGASATSLASGLSATLVDEEAGVARLLPQDGESPLALVERMSLDTRVLTTEQNAILEPSEMRGQEPFASDDGNGSPHTYGHQPAAEALKLADAHTLTAGAGVRVAVLDTGIDPAHPVFGGRIAASWDFVSNDPDPTEFADGLDNDGDGRVDEGFGHGTHVAGIVTLTAPRASLLVGRVLDSDGRGDVASIARGLRWAIDQRARVINLSLGMLRGSDAIQRLLDEADLRGIVVVSTAGNYGSDSPREFPGTSSHAFAVAASLTDARPASFTSYGSHVDVSAPGVGIRSTFPGGGYRVWSGTSMSAPFVSGTAALLVALHPDWGGHEVFERIESTVTPLVGVPLALEGGLGEGMLNVGAALAPDRPLPGEGGDPVEVLRRP